MTNIFNTPEEWMPYDANYYFNVVVIQIAVRESVWNKDLQIVDLWDLECITNARPLAVHIFMEDDSEFEEDENYYWEIHPHMAVEVSDSLGVALLEMLDEEDYEEEYFEEDGDTCFLAPEDPEDLWRL